MSNLCKPCITALEMFFFPGCYQIRVLRSALLANKRAHTILFPLQRRLTRHLYTGDIPIELCKTSFHRIVRIAASSLQFENESLFLYLRNMF